MCREEGRIITINPDNKSIHVSKANVIPKDSPLKKIIKISGDECLVFISIKITYLHTYSLQNVLVFIECMHNYNDIWDFQHRFFSIKYKYKIILYQYQKQRIWDVSGR